MLRVAIQVVALIAAVITVHVLSIVLSPQAHTAAAITSGAASLHHFIRDAHSLVDLVNG